LPTAAYAVATRGNNIGPQTNPPMMNLPQTTLDHRLTPAQQPIHGQTWSIGGGMQGGNEPGHTAGPGGAKVDQDARGPVNDVQVGRGTNDTPQSKNPPPVR
jgi:hypothetical protein